MAEGTRGTHTSSRGTGRKRCRAASGGTALIALLPSLGQLTVRTPGRCRRCRWPWPGRSGGVGHRGGLGFAAEGERGIFPGAVAVPARDVDDHDLAGLDLSEQDLLRQLVFDLALNGASQRSGTEHGVEATLGQQLLGLLGDLDSHVLVSHRRLDPGDHQVDHLHDLFGRELVEHHDVVDAVEELGAEVFLQFVVDLLLHPVVGGFGT